MFPCCRAPVRGASAARAARGRRRGRRPLPEIDALLISPIGFPGRWRSSGGLTLYGRLLFLARLVFELSSFERR